jgi:hypothetical protein
MTGRGRAARASTFAVVCLALATGAHWFGSGMLPGPRVLIAAGAAAAVVGWLVVPRRGPLLLAGTTVAVQLGMHMGFAASMTRGAMTPMSLILCRGHDAAAPLPVHVTALPIATHASGGVLGAAGVPMLAGHLVAAVLAGLWMHHGERLFTSLGALLDAVRTAVLRVVRGWVVAIPTGARIRRAGVAPRISRQFLDRAIAAAGLRGPPVTLPC